MKLHFHRAGLLLALLIGWALSSGGSARAASTVIFNNITNGNNGNFGTDTNTWDAQRFNSDATNLFLSSVTLRLSYISGSGTFSLSLYSDNANQPGTSLATLFTGINPGSGDILFGGLNQPLAPSSNYWLVLGENAGATMNLGWGVTLSSAGSGSGFQTTTARSLNQGVNWSVDNSAPFQAVITAVPEPGSALLGLLGGGGLLWAARRDRRGSRDDIAPIARGRARKSTG
ncbi:MAG: PEP-CTERM sorting domain-containing protein [Verrucomicrobia bacterium]|nr:PEP-CTERM sorting domain-containing protein [Verrucomicrobiota bacterium]